MPYKGLIDDLAATLGQHALRLGDKSAVECGDQKISYRQLDERSTAFARSLSHAGIAPGARVAFLGKACTEYFEFLVGAIKAGAVPVPINWRLASPEILAIVEDCEAELLVVSSEFADKIEQPADKIANLAIIISLDESGSYPSWSDWLGQAGDRAASEPAGDAGRVILQIYTSGTTGRPKGVMTTAAAFRSYLATLSDVASLHETSVTLSTMPLFHIGGTGWAMAGLFSGATVILLRDVDPDEILRIVEAHRVTNLIAVPSVVQMLLQSSRLERTDFSSLTHIYYGGGPMTEMILRKALESFDCEFTQGFGMSECPLIASLAPEFHFPQSKLLRSFGVPVDGTQIRLVEPETGLDVPQGSIGEIWVQSPQVCAGYWKQPAITQETIVADGWLRTGDAASRDEDGFLYMQDRLKDMIVTGGENVYPAEVENALMSHPAVRECAVIGVASEKWIETVKAIIVLSGDANPAAEDLIAHCKARLAGYKCPTIVEFTRTLPRNPAGKILKYELRQQAGKTGV